MSSLSANEVAARLGVKLDTVYAYVSRGVLSPHREPGSRRSAFDSGDVEELARRGRPRRATKPSALDLVVETGLTTILDHQIRYRGRDARSMARACAFEQTADWLWTGKNEKPFIKWEPYPVFLPTGLSHPRDRIRAAVVLASTAEPLRADLSAPAVTTCTRRLIATMVNAVADRPEARAAQLVLDKGRSAVRGSVAGRLWGSLTDIRPTQGLVATLNAALVLLADHELASSTVAARIAASVRADPFSVVLAGLGPLGGPLHAGTSALVHQMIADATKRGPEMALGAAIETYGHLPGFGHRLYPCGDPRAKTLLEMINSTAADAPGLRAAHALIEGAHRHSGREPNIDFALGVLSTVARMPATAGETLFTVARTAGWIAHAIEEYEEAPVRFRARAVPKRAEHR